MAKKAVIHTAFLNAKGILRRTAEHNSSKPCALAYDGDPNRKPPVDLADKDTTAGAMEFYLVTTLERWRRSARALCSVRISSGRRLPNFSKNFPVAATSSDKSPRPHARNY